RHAPTASYTRSLHDALPILRAAEAVRPAAAIQDGDGNWQVVEAQQDGSYLVFEAPASGQLLLLDQPTPNLIPIVLGVCIGLLALDRKSTRLNSSHVSISYAV